MRKTKSKVSTTKHNTGKHWQLNVISLNREELESIEEYEYNEDDGCYVKKKDITDDTPKTEEEEKQRGR